jgi:hypothetical protein
MFVGDMNLSDQRIKEFILGQVFSGAEVEMNLFLQKWSYFVGELRALVTCYIIEYNGNNSEFEVGFTPLLLLLLRSLSTDLRMNPMSITIDSQLRVEDLSEDLSIKGILDLIFTDTTGDTVLHHYEVKRSHDALAESNAMVTASNSWDKIFS